MVLKQSKKKKIDKFEIIVHQTKSLYIKYLLPYSGATKCMFLMFSWQVLTWWCIESGATREKGKGKVDK